MKAELSALILCMEGLPRSGSQPIMKAGALKEIPYSFFLSSGLKNSLTPWDKTQALPQPGPGEEGRSSVLVGPSPSQSPLLRDVLWAWKSSILIALKEDRAVGSAVSSWDGVTSVAGTHAGERSNCPKSGPSGIWTKSTERPVWVHEEEWRVQTHSLEGGGGRRPWLPDPSAECTAAVRAGWESPHGFPPVFLMKGLKPFLIRKN